MLHKTVKATATAVDQGVFSALAATYSTDRVGDRIIKGAFENTIAAWQESQKQVPVHWDHEGAAASVIGSVDPKSMQETDDGLYVEGKLDLEDSETAREAWRSMKDNRVSLSFGYMTTRERKAKDGINELLEIDLFEVSIVPAPANPGTRLLSLKNADGAVVEEPETETPVEVPPTEEPTEETPSAEELRKHTFDLALELAGGATKAHEGDDAGLSALEEALKDRRVQLALWKALKSIAETGDLPTEPAPEPVDAETLRKRSFDVALELAKRTPNERPKKSAPAKAEEEAPTDNTVDSPTREMVQNLIDGLKAAGVLKVETAEEPETETPPDEQTGEPETPETSETSAVEDGKDEEPEKAKAKDPLRKRTFDLALGISNGGMRVPSHLPEPEPEPEPLNEAELRRQSLELALEIARGESFGSR